MRNLLALAALAAIMPAAHAASCQATSPKNTVALVELYTSQGCSSCPPADRWLSQLPSRIDANRAIPLALHVGYWDYIGWKDPFAKREFNDRQSQLAALNGNRTRYTPGVFVQGRETNWSSGAFDAQLRAVNQRPAAATIKLDNVETQSRQSQCACPRRACNSFISQESASDSLRWCKTESRPKSRRAKIAAKRWRTTASRRAWSGPLPLGSAAFRWKRRRLLCVISPGRIR